MSSERPDEFSESPANKGQQASDDKGGSETAGERPIPAKATPREAIVVVRGETVPDQEPKSAPKDAAPKASPSNASPPKDKEKSERKEVSEAKVKMRSRLPVLDDDSDVGVQKEQNVIRDGKADLAFTGTLLACAAPPSPPKGQWQEYRIYATNGGKHVFSKVTRTVFAEEPDTHEAEIFDPSPSSVPSQLLRSARDLTRSRPTTWIDAAVSFFGYDPLAKALYRKLSGRFEEHIS